MTPMMICTCCLEIGSDVLHIDHLPFKNCKNAIPLSGYLRVQRSRLEKAERQLRNLSADYRKVGRIMQATELDPTIRKH